MKTIALLRAEGRKIKSGTAMFLVPLTVGLLLAVVFLAHNLDVHRLSSIGQDPWPRFFRTALTSYVMILASPLCVLLVASVFYVEQRADAWKQLYALPISRPAVLMAKLALLLGLNALAVGLYCLGIWWLGYWLGYRFPEYEMSFFSPDLPGLWATGSKIFVAVMGLTALQFLLHLLFKSIITPLGIGFFGIIAGFILSTTEAGFTRWVPYAYPLIVHDSNATNAMHREAVLGGWSAGVVGSLIWLLACVAIALWWEQRRQVF